VTGGRSLLDRLLQPRALRAVFQPVVHLARDGRPVCYHEGLVRGPRGTSAERPDVLFEYARRKLAEVQVDRAAVRAVVRAARWTRPSQVGLNVHRCTLALDPDFIPFLARVLSSAGIRAGAVVIELVEHGHPCSPKALLPRLDALRRLGIRIALDDFGTGESNYLMLLECRPDYVKVDRRLVHGGHGDDRREAFLESLAVLADRVGAQPVAEGVETERDLDRVSRVGIALAQGFLLGRPASFIPG
jgi:EAL domain-containing protein (putative c-di-GMP-specific phosphodiesterase class I)